MRICSREKTKIKAEKNPPLWSLVYVLEQWNRTFCSHGNVLIFAIQYSDHRAGGLTNLISNSCNLNSVYKTHGEWLSYWEE